MESLDTKKSRQMLEEILAKEEYQVYYKEEQGNWLEALKERIGEILELLFPNIPINQSTELWVTYIIFAVFILIVLFLLFRISRYFSRGSLSSKPIREQGELNQTTDQILKEADQFALNKDFESAIRLSFIALIVFLNEKHWIEANDWKTNMEYYEELKQNSNEKAAAFYEIAVIFEKTVYGGQLARESDYRSYRRQIEESFLHSPSLKNITNEGAQI